jgi:RNA polymerase sigma-70 factor (ECF subfamily)
MTGARVLDDPTGEGMTTGSGSPRPDLETVFRDSYAALVRGLSLVCDDPAAVVQEAFLEAYRRWDSVGSYEDPAAWVRHVAVNKAHDRRRRRATERRFAARLVGRPPVDRSTEDELDLRAALRRLPPRERMAIGLHYVADLKVSEVAAAMSTSEGAVKALLHAGRKRLARDMEVKGDG